MNDDAKDFHAALEHLRQVSRVYLPNMAEHYANSAKAMTHLLPYGAGAYASAASFLETADFLKGDGGEAMCGKWVELADLYTAALAHTGNTYWYTAQVLDWALDSFEDEDNVNAGTLEDLQEKAENSGIGDEHKGGYDHVDPPDHKDPSK